MSDTTPANPPAVDPFVQSIATSMGIALDGITPTEKPAEQKPEAGSTTPEPSTQADKGTGETTPTAESGQTQPEAGESKPKTEPADKAPESDDLDRAVGDLVAAKPKDSRQDKKEDPAPKDPIEESLTEEERDEIEFARYADKNGSPGAYAKTVEFFKRLQEFSKENPDAEADSSEFKTFIEKHRPKYPNRAKIERSWIEDRATERAKKAIAGDAEKIKARQAELELRPKVDKVVTEFRKAVQSGDLPTGVTRVLDGVADTISSEGYEKAAAKFPIEAPIVQGHVDAAEQYVRIVNGIEPFNPQNPVHAWIGRFVETQEGIYMSRPESERVSGGKTFLPGAKYAELLTTNPAEAAKHWTFSDAEVLRMMAVNANMVASQKIKSLEAAGFERKVAPKEKPAQTAPPPAASAKPAQQPGQQRQSQQAPKAGIAPSSGPAAPAVTGESGNSQLLERLVPGASKRV